MADIDDPFAGIPPNQWTLPVRGWTAAEEAQVAEPTIAAHGLAAAPHPAPPPNPERFKDQLRALVQRVQQHAEAVLQSAGTVYPAACGAAALAAAAEGLHSTGGRIFYFASSAPLIGAGRLRPREDHAGYGHEREATMWRPLSPQAGAKEERDAGEWYRKLADDCAARQVAVDMFLIRFMSSGGTGTFNGTGGLSPVSSWMDTATLGQVPHATGGKLMLFADVEAPTGSQVARCATYDRSGLSHGLCCR